MPRKGREGREHGRLGVRWWGESVVSLLLFIYAMASLAGSATGGRRGRRARKKAAPPAEAAPAPANDTTATAEPSATCSVSTDSPGSKVLRVLRQEGCPEGAVEETVLEYLANMAADELTDASTLASVLESMSILPDFEDKDDREKEQVADAIFSVVRVGPTAEEREAAAAAEREKNTHRYTHLKRDETTMAMAMSMGWGMKKQNVNDGMNGWVGQGATIVDWLAANSKQGKRKIRLEAKEEERRRALLDKHVAAIKNLRQSEAEALKHLPSRLLPSASSTSDIHADACEVTAPDGKVLIGKADIKLVYGRKYGLIGKNGTGKTTLLRALARKEIPIPADLRLVHCSQEIDGTDRTAMDEVMGCDYELNAALSEQEQILNDPDPDPHALEDICLKLELLEADTAKARAVRILMGLNFTSDMLDVPTKRLSGGWRQRVALAKGLYLEPALLLLDEPTNHLDLESVLWLENFLQTYDKTLVVVSHDRMFLQHVCTDIMYLHRQKLAYYRGNYETFVATSAEDERRQLKAYEAQQGKLAHMQAFVDKNRASAALASMASSRQKAIDKMEKVEKVVVDPTTVLRFPDPGPLFTGGGVVQVTDVDFRYSQETPLLLKGLNFGIGIDSRIGLVGPNGVGKSTLLNVIYGYSEPVRGYVTRNQKLRIGVFSQHHTESLDLRLTPLEQMRSAYDGFAGTKGEEKARAQLGDFGVTGAMATRPIVTLSGGQKSRLVLAMVMWKKPHLLILDEPTNHLDMETITALAVAINHFKGGVIVVSHDQHFMDMCLNEIWEIRDQGVHRLDGGLEDYRKSTLKRMGLKPR